MVDKLFVYYIGERNKNFEKLFNLNNVQIIYIPIDEWNNRIFHYELEELKLIKNKKFLKLNQLQLKLNQIQEDIKDEETKEFVTNNIKKKIQYHQRIYNNICEKLKNSEKIYEKQQKLSKFIFTSYKNKELIHKAHHKLVFLKFDKDPSYNIDIVKKYIKKNIANKNKKWYEIKDKELKDYFNSQYFKLPTTKIYINELIFINKEVQNLHHAYILTILHSFRRDTFTKTEFYNFCRKKLNLNTNRIYSNKQSSIKTLFNWCIEKEFIIEYEKNKFKKNKILLENLKNDKKIEKDATYFIIYWLKEKEKFNLNKFRHLAILFYACMPQYYYDKKIKYTSSKYYFISQEKIAEILNLTQPCISKHLSKHTKIFQFELITKEEYEFLKKNHSFNNSSYQQLFYHITPDGYKYYFRLIGSKTMNFFKYYVNEHNKILKYFPHNINNKIQTFEISYKYPILNNEEKFCKNEEEQLFFDLFKIASIRKFYEKIIEIFNKEKTKYNYNFKEFLISNINKIVNIEIMENNEIELIYHKLIKNLENLKNLDTSKLLIILYCLNLFAIKKITISKGKEDVKEKIISFIEQFPHIILHYADLYSFKFNIVNKSLNDALHILHNILNLNYICNNKLLRINKKSKFEVRKETKRRNFFFNKCKFLIKKIHKLSFLEHPEKLKKIIERRDYVLGYKLKDNDKVFISFTFGNFKLPMYVTRRNKKWNKILLNQKDKLFDLILNVHFDQMNHLKYNYINKFNQLDQFNKFNKFNKFNQLNNKNKFYNIVNKEKRTNMHVNQQMNEHTNKNVDHQKNELNLTFNYKNKILNVHDNCSNNNLNDHLNNTSININNPSSIFNLKFKF